MSRRSHSVLIGFREISGYCRNLRTGFEEIGVRATFVDLWEDPRGYASATDQRGLVRLVAWLHRRAIAASGLPRPVWRLLYRSAMVVLFASALVRYDTFVFRSSYSFFSLRELPLLRALGKTVIHVYLGSDTRPSYLNGAEVADGQPMADLARSTADKRRLLARVERHATWIVSHGPSSHLHARPFVGFLTIGLPYPIAGEPASQTDPDQSVATALHAPSNLDAKGTQEVRAAVARLRAAGVALELREIRDVPNREVLAAIAASDFVIDQAYSDTPMATFAAEAAALGRPAVVGGYAWEELRAETPAAGLPPAQLCDPSALDAAIRQLVEDRGRRVELGRAAQAFVRESWSPAAVARRFLLLIDGRAPAAWFVDPATIRNVTGVGLSAARARETVQRLVDELGPGALQLDHNPGLRDALLASAAGAVPAIPG
jgi:glycosyltransferase involved in cell wall biosynthesis